MSQWQTCYDRLIEYLCPPGEGVYTVHTAQEKKQTVQKQLFNATGDAVKPIWKQQLQNLPQQEKPLLLGVCSDTGGGILRGANWGPLFVRESLLQFTDVNYVDIGDVRVIPHLLHDKYLNEATLKNCREALYGDANASLAVSPLSITEAVTDELFTALPKTKLFTIGGDHSVSYPLVKQYLIAKKQQGINAGVLHFDAHTDLLAQRLGIDLCFGSWTYHILQYLNDPQQLIQVGIRSTGKSQQYWQDTFNIQQLWAKQVEQQGAESIAADIIKHYKQQHVEELYISVDIDALDMQFASATGTAEQGGLHPDDVITIINAVATEFNVTGADLMEVAPFIKQHNASTPPEPETTLTNAARIARALLHAF